MKALSSRANVGAKELMKTAKSRVEWRVMTATALKEHSTPRERDGFFRCDVRAKLISCQHGTKSKEFLKNQTNN